LIRSSVSIKII